MSARKVARLAALLAVALLLGILENLLPPVMPLLPYARLGLGNVAILLALAWYGLPYAAVILVLKCVLIGIFSGAPIMILYSLGGGMLSLLAMWALLALNANGLPAVSAVGGILHNVGQVIVAMLITRTPSVAIVLVYLSLFGGIAGALTGVLSYYLLRLIPFERANKTSFAESRTGEEGGADEPRE